MCDRQTELQMAVNTCVAFATKKYEIVIFQKKKTRSTYLITVKIFDENEKGFRSNFTRDRISNKI